MGEKKSAYAGQLNWLLRLLAHSRAILEARHRDDLGAIADRIKADTVLTDLHRVVLRLLFKSRWGQGDGEAAGKLPKLYEGTSPDKEHDDAMGLGQVLDILSICQLVTEAGSLDQLKAMGTRIGEDKLLTEDMKQLLRKAFTLRAGEIG